MFLSGSSEILLRKDDDVRQHAAEIVEFQNALLSIPQ